jgi:hypothetical protein
MIRKHTDWQAMAAEAERVLADQPRGRRVAATFEIARKHELGVPTLRRFLLANRFLEQLPPDIRDVAASMPAVAVATAARWHSHNPSGALGAIRDYAEGKYDVRTFEDAEAAARSARRSAVGIRLANAYAKEVEHRIDDGNFETLWPLDARENPIVRKTDFLPDLSGKVNFFGMSRGGGKPVAVLVVGPYATPQMYAERAVDWCLRALGLRVLHRRVALVLPENSYAAAFVRFLDGIPNDATKDLMIVRDMLPLGARARRRGRQ